MAGVGMYAAAALADLLGGDFEVGEFHHAVSLEMFSNSLLYGAIILRLDRMGRALGDAHDASVAHDEFAILKHIEWPCEHGFAVGEVAIYRYICGGTGSEMPLVREAQRPGRCGARHDGDLIQRILPGEAGKAAGGCRIRMDARQHVGSETLVH